MGCMILFVYHPRELSDRNMALLGFNANVKYEEFYWGTRIFCFLRSRLIVTSQGKFGRVLHNALKHGTNKFTIALI